MPWLSSSQPSNRASHKAARLVAADDRRLMTAQPDGPSSGPALVTSPSPAPGITTESVIILPDPVVQAWASVPNEYEVISGARRRQ